MVIGKSVGSLYFILYVNNEKKQTRINYIVKKGDLDFRKSSQFNPANRVTCFENGSLQSSDPIKASVLVTFLLV